MSQFFWQNALKNSNDGRQYSFDEKYQNDKNTNSQWSNIGLVENENDQRTTQYYPAEWSYGQVDPYSTAVFEGFNAAPGERHDYVENHNSNNSGYSQAEDQQRQHLLENNYKSAHLIQMIKFQDLKHSNQYNEIHRPILPQQLKSRKQVNESSPCQTTVTTETFAIQRTDEKDAVKSLDPYQASSNSYQNIRTTVPEIHSHISDKNTPNQLRNPTLDSEKFDEYQSKDYLQNVYHDISSFKNNAEIAVREKNNPEDNHLEFNKEMERKHKTQCDLMINREEAMANKFEETSLNELGIRWSEPQTMQSSVTIAQVIPMMASVQSISIAHGSNNNYSNASVTCDLNVSSSGVTNVARVDPIPCQHSEALNSRSNTIATAVLSHIQSTPDIPSVSNSLSHQNNTPAFGVSENMRMSVQSRDNISSPLVHPVAPTNNILNEISKPEEFINNLEPDVPLDETSVGNENVVSPICQDHIDKALPVETNDSSIITTVKQNSEASVEIPGRATELSQSLNLSDVTKVVTMRNQPTEIHSKQTFNSINERNKGRGSVRDRYRYIRQQYPEIVKRLDRLRADAHTIDWRNSSKNILRGSLQENDQNLSVLNRPQKNSTPKEFDNIRFPDASFDHTHLSKMNHSFTVADKNGSDHSSLRESGVYGDEFVSSQRRSRFAKRGNSGSLRGTRSEMGEIGPYRGYAAQLYHFQQSHQGFKQSGFHPFYGYPSGRQSQGPTIGRHTPHDQRAVHPMDAPSPRPMSCFDYGGYSRYEQSGHSGNYDAYNRFDGTDLGKNNESSKSSQNDSAGTDDEVAQLYYNQQVHRSMSMQYGFDPSIGPDEFYYFGAIHLSQNRVANIFHKYPPPAEYYHLSAIEKAAYIFYCALYLRHYQPVDLFHKKFNREYYKYICEGDSPEIALWKICKHTQDEFNARRSLEKLKAYEMAQKQLFSDDRETLDSRASDHASRCEDDSDRLSVDSSLKEPLKFRVPHAFLNFCVDGRVLLLDPTLSISIVEIRDVKDLVNHSHFNGIIESIESFKGPLIPGYTPAHSIRLYIQRQIEIIRQSDLFLADSNRKNVDDCLLIWQLLEMVVQQQGRITGPDLSRLLMSGHQIPQFLFENKTFDFGQSAELRDPKAYELFTQFLLGGHVDEAIDCAMKNGLYSDALILARRIYAHDIQKLQKIEATYLSLRSECNPVVTLMNVANGFPAPILTSTKINDSKGWRAHAAIVLANLCTPMAFETVYQLGQVLARHEYYYAADFCFLAVYLLANYDPFHPVQNNDGSKTKKHINLIHATLPDADNGFKNSKDRFSQLDLHATEILEYALKLANGGLPVALTRSTAYQSCRLEYAEKISEFGGFSNDAFRYCIDIARAIWDRCGEFTLGQLNRLCDLADRLHYVASATESEIAWIPPMRDFIKQCVNVCNTQHQNDNTKPDVKPHEIVQEQELAIIASRRRTISLSSEAAEWHADRQEPIQIGVKINNDNRPEIIQEAIPQDDCIGQYPLAQKTVNVVDNALKGSEQAVNNECSSISHSNELGATAQKSTEIAQGSKDFATDGHVNTRKENGPSNRHATFWYGETAEFNTTSNCTTDEATESTTTTTTSHEGTPIRYPRFSVTNELKKQKPVNDMSDGVSYQADNSLMMPSKGDIRSNKQLLSSTSTACEDEQKKLQPAATIPSNTLSNNAQSQARLQTSNFLSKLAAKLVKAIPSTNEMILPDDSNPSIVWDAAQRKFVGPGIEEETNVAPPPLTSVDSTISNTSVCGLTAARVSGGSRYFNPLMDATQNQPAQSANHPAIPLMQIPTIGFIPRMPDDDVTTESPFSVGAPAELVTAISE